ncbi:MAG: DNA-binding response OmpR family regulator [Bradymonadia bacterium]|jgi:DNA-binding response OmpR family regulator
MADKPRVAVIDDSEIVRVSVEVGLSAEGWEVSQFDNGYGVTNRVKQANPQIVLLDVNMPLVTGDKLAGILRKQLGASVKILLHSSMSASKLRGKVREAGADGYIEKTSDPAQLSRKLNHFLRAP